MSELKDRLAADFKSALKSKDTAKKDLVQLVRAGVLQKEKDEQIDATDSDVIAVVQKEIKKRQELIDELEDNRPEAADKARQEIKILETYLPEMLSDEEVEILVRDVVARVDARGLQDMGKVIKTAIQEADGQADGAKISRIVKKVLSEL